MPFSSFWVSPDRSGPAAPSSAPMPSSETSARAADAPAPAINPARTTTPNPLSLLIPTPPAGRGGLEVGLGGDLEVPLRLEVVLVVGDRLAGLDESELLAVEQVVDRRLQPEPPHPVGHRQVGGVVARDDVGRRLSFG